MFMLPEARQSIVEKVRAAEPEEMLSALRGFYEEFPAEKATLGEMVMTYGHSRHHCETLGADYVRLSRLDMLRLEYYAMLERLEELKKNKEETQPNIL